MTRVRWLLAAAAMVAVLVIGSTTAAASCDTVVFVRVGDDAYVEYALSGGP